MKTLIVTAVAAAILAAPSLALARDMQGDGRGEPRHEQQAPQRHVPPQSGHDDRRQPAHVAPRHEAAPRYSHEESRVWHRGDRFDRHDAPHYTRVVTVAHYGLRPPQPGYVWVRSGFDALLVRLSNNIVVAISPGIFR